MSAGKTKTAGDPQEASVESTPANLEGYKIVTLAIEVIFIPSHLRGRLMKSVELFPDGCFPSTSSLVQGYVCCGNYIYCTDCKVVRHHHSFAGGCRICSM